MVSDYLSSFIDGLMPIRQLEVWEWADQFRKLTSDSSAEPGDWQTPRVPWLKQPMRDASSNSIVQEIIVQKGSQLAFTELAINIIGCYSDIDPCGIFYILPTQDMAEASSKKRIQPMINQIPQLVKKFGRPRDRDSGNNILSKIIPGGSVEMINAGSPAKLSSQPIRIVICDEINRFPKDVGGEGSAVDLARTRTSTFQNKKIYLLSTPTDGSGIELLIDGTDYNEYYVPCPACLHKQTLKFDNLVYEITEVVGKKKCKPESVRYKCEDCDHLIEERFKPWMFKEKSEKNPVGAEWIPRFPERVDPLKKGYFIPSLYSAYGWLSWVELIDEYLNCFNSEGEVIVEKMKVFYNTKLALPYHEAGEVPAWKEIYNRREHYKIGTAHQDVAFITSGIDIQKNRIELEVVGWCKGRESYSIDYVVLPGNTDEEKVWNDLYNFITGTQYLRQDGSYLPITMSGIDTNYNTKIVYDFCRRLDPTRIMAIDGQSNLVTIVGTPKPVDSTKSGKKIKGMMLWPVGVDMLKSETYSFLKAEIREDGTFPQGFCHFPQYDMEHFRRLTAEALVTEINKKTNQQETYWKKVYNRNEQLDCRVYARAAASLLGIDRMTDEDYKRIHAGYFIKKAEAPKIKPTKKSDYWEGYD
jgi:phage terminase large subunit GpA-like protein